jgi:hypothetical protein
MALPLPRISRFKPDQHCGSITQINLNVAVACNVGATRPGDVHAEATFERPDFHRKGTEECPVRFVESMA